MENQKLGIRQREYAIATEERHCDLCGRSIPVGTAYLQTAKVVAISGELAINKTIECLRSCSEASDELEPREFEFKKRPEVWADMPATATELERSYRIETAQGGIWVATGYRQILRLGQFEYLEVANDQVQKRSFASDPRNADSFGKFEGWVTSDGMRAREYLQDDRNCLQGHWYLPLHFLRPNKTPRLPILADALSKARAKNGAA